MTSPTSQVEINGVPPDIAGGVCQELILQPYYFEGELLEPANVIHLNIDGQWHRLCFDYAIVFWRKSDAAPEPWSDEARHYDNPLVDLGTQAAVVGARVERYVTSGDAASSSVEFVFSNGRHIVFTSRDDHTTYQVI